MSKENRLTNDWDPEQLLEQVNKQQSVLVLNMGGTINMAGAQSRSPSGSLADVLAEIADIPHQRIDVFSPPPDSTNVGAEHWTKLASLVSQVAEAKIGAVRALDDYGLKSSVGGVVVTHGTDTLEYTALVLALELSRENLSFPIVITGSHSPVDQVRSDAIDNLRRSLLMTAPSHIKERIKVGPPIPNHVYVLIGRDLHLASRIKKTHTKPNEEGVYFTSHPDMIGRFSGLRLSFFDGYLAELKRPKIVPLFSEKPTRDFGYVEHLIIDRTTPFRTYQDAMVRLLDWVNSHPNQRCGLVLQGDASRADARTLRQVNELAESLLESRVVVAVGSVNFRKCIFSKEVALIPKCLTYPRARTKLQWLLRWDFPVGETQRWLEMDFAGEIYEDTAIPDWVQYETYGPNNYMVGKEVLQAYPGMSPIAVRDSVDRLLSTGISRRSLRIWGLGDGHIPLREEPLWTVLCRHLEQVHPILIGQSGSETQIEPPSGVRDFLWIRGFLAKAIHRLSESSRSAFLKGFEIRDSEGFSRIAVEAMIKGIKLERYEQLGVDRLLARLTGSFQSNSESLDLELAALARAIGKNPTMARDLTRLLVGETEGIWTDLGVIVQERLEQGLGLEVQLRPCGTVGIREVISWFQEQAEAEPDMVKEWVSVNHPGVFAERIVKDSLAAWHPSLLALDRAIEAGVRVRIHTTVSEGRSDTRVYEVGNLLQIIGARSDVAPGWQANPLSTRLSRNGL